MSHHFFLYDKNVFCSEGLRTVISALFSRETDYAFSYLDNFPQLVDTLSLPEKKDGPRYVLCDVGSLPGERFNALFTIKELHSNKNQKLVMMLDENNISLFFALHSFLPQASWLLKSETVNNVFDFFMHAKDIDPRKICFSQSLINYANMKWLSRDIKKSISSDDWWLMEEIFTGKSLSKISVEQQVDIRRLSRHKRDLMKKLNARNNVELFNIFRCIIATPCI